MSNDVAGYLGTTKNFEEDIVDRFRDCLQTFIDSKIGKGPSDTLSFWISLTLSFLWTDY